MKCDAIVEKYQSQLELQYFHKENSGQGFSRNYGFEKAKGNYFVVFDSDCIIPPHYFQSVETALELENLDAYGGPDKADASFSIVQKAINYSMTSLFTTGGIRGAKRHAATYHPRSFNMGISREVYQKTGGYAITRKGEDIDLSIRILKAGFKIGLVSEAFVYHKRRTSLGQFFKQLHFFGRARVNVQRLHPGELKLVHLFPLLFTLGLLATLLINPFLPECGRIGALLYSIYFGLIFIDSTVRNRSLIVGLVSILAAVVQLSAYAIGMIREIARSN